MNLISKKSLLICALLLTWVSQGHAINLNALYLSACEREVGVITGVDKSNVQLLKTDGTTVKVPRYEIIYWTTYPLDILPMKKVEGGKDLRLVNIKTLENNNIVDLIRGWPIDFSETKISFLTTAGGEAVIDRDSIWDVSVTETPKEFAILNNIGKKYEFSHPYSFAYCPVKYEGDQSSREKPIVIYPQQILSDPVVIKKELDRLKKGHDGVTDYEREQQFYAVPQVYKNITSLGLWASAPSRYGASSTRTNYTPVLIDQYSSGPFGYQRLFLTGSAPILSSVQEEPQTQILYRFKADYFHAQVMIDPNLVLVGDNYKWQIQDIPGGHDDRIVEMGSVEFGFDFGHFAFNLQPAGSVDIGINVGGTLAEDVGNLPRVGVTYQNQLFKVDAQYGTSSFDQYNLSFFRANGELTFIRNFDLVYSFIYRNMSFGDPLRFQYSSTSLTNATYAKMNFNQKFSAGNFLSFEMLKNQYGLQSLSSSGQNSYPKGGLFGALSF